jgi:hypothetical protein
MVVDQAALTPVQARERLVEALELDLVGPWPGHELAEEMLHRRTRPSNWYLTGFLIPLGAPLEQSADADSDDEFEDVPESEGFAEESAEERVAAKKAYFPSSMGLSTLVPAGSKALTAKVCWGDYTLDEHRPDDGAPIPVWRRTPREATVEIALGGNPGELLVHTLPGSDGLELHTLERPVDSAGTTAIPTGTRSTSVFLVNNRPPEAEQPDTAYVFQPVLELRCVEPFVPRPDLRAVRAVDWDDRVAELHYADTPEYATGHGVSGDWDIDEGRCTVLRTRWIPRADVEKTETAPISDVELSMEVLGALTDGAAAQAALLPLVERYREWIAKQHEATRALDPRRRETAEGLLANAELAASRIERGIATLADDADVLDAFRVANRAVAAALRRRLGIDDPQWRAFQLAFVLVNVPGIADPADVDRDTVDLLFFPTGGGKTEAYLGLSAFTIVLRRLRIPHAGGRAGAGVSVVMRYTLRLLTLDQLQRAAGLVCALELEREHVPERYGEWPFEIGLWVGKAATPNVLGHMGDGRSDTARAKVSRYKNEPGRNPSPIPLEECPWCETRFKPDSFTLRPDSDYPKQLRVACANFECEFSGDRTLPIVAVDEPLYRRLPAFLVATVDKFATLPWVGPSGALLGGAERSDADGFYGPAEPGKGRPLPAPLPPPDLVIQDELHLISGPLGTMAGLFETAIEALCVRTLGDRTVRPKVVASTATVRRAQDQIQALFARPLTQIFPPPGPDRRDSFFACTLPASERPARRYVGVAAQGRNPKVAMRKVWLALMGAAEHLYREEGGHENHNNPVDPYMTLLGYFNSLRELGGGRRIIEEEVRNTLQSYGQRQRVADPRRLFRDRRTFSEVVELTSRVSTDRVADARRKLGLPFHEPDRVDCAIATNMISVGLDIPRLGLMGVLGQPKTTAEYIQATSRVGRTDDAPGLVVTLLNVHKPRDRSHYERFRHYHETFYRSVEVGSITPFSARALDRGFAGALVAGARHLRPELTPATGAQNLAVVRSDLERRLLGVFRQRLLQQPMSEDERVDRLAGVQDRVVDLLDSWQNVGDAYASVGAAMKYQRYEPDSARPLLREMLDSDFESEHHRKFRVNRSLRDVEPEVNLFLHDLTGDAVGDDS